MKHFKLFFALFAMLALGVGNAWGETVTLDFTSNKYSLVTSGTDTEKTFSVDGFTFGYKQCYYNSSKYLMLVKSKAVLYCTNPIGTTIQSIAVTYSSGTSEKGKLDVFFVDAKKDTRATTGYDTQLSVTKSGTATATNSNNGKNYFNLSTHNSNNIQVTKIVITYENTAGGDEPTPSLTADPTTIDFGTVYQDATVADKTVAVNFANLTGNVTYSGLSTPFSATGAISATGDKITISADASTIGTYSQTLTVASTADSKTAEVTVKMNVVEKPAPTGTFTLHTGELIEGDYVIYYSGKAMKAEVASSRLQYVEVTPSNNEIVDPAAAAIWHIAKSGANWTVYNNNKGYAAGTGTKSQAGLVANLTGDNANKAAWTVTASGNAYEFVNVWNKSKSVNANLRNNTTYGFACYATSTGGALSLYRKAGTKYNVTVSSTTNGAVTADPTSAEAGTTITLTITPETGYVLDALTVTDASSNPVTVTDNKFTMPASDVTVTATFKENEKPAATLTLSKNGVEETFPGSWKQDDVVTLPSITSDCVKEFVGWSANPTCNVAPEYKAGDEYTLAATAQTLYAVYATAGAGETLTITPSAVSGSADPYTFTIDAAGYSLTAKKNSGSTAPTYNASNKDVRVYAKGTVTLTAPKALNTIVFNISTQGKKRLAPITASVGAIATQASGDATVTWTGDATEVTFTVGDNANYGSESDKAGQLCFGTITVTTAGSYSNYSTTCVGALAAPTFSVAEGTYTEAQSITLSAAKGTIYYTLDGTTPTASSEKYTTPIVLDVCGEYTIKAIAISSDNESPVASATYKMDLDIATGSVDAPLTTTEAKQLYESGCYNAEQVYVTGQVKNAQFYTSSNTYTITLTDGFQFYKFYDLEGAEFEDDYIKPGDVIVGYGKIDLYNSNYQLASGCYLVDYTPNGNELISIKNTEATAYTVEEARNFIDNGATYDLSEEVYVKGIVSKIVTPFDATYGNISYNISADGKTTSAQLQAYRGLSLDGAPFASENDILVGDEVVVVGTLTKYGSTYEFNAGNKLVSKVRKEEPTPEPEVPAVEPTATFIFNTADGLSNLGITYPATDGGSGALMTEFANNDSFTQDGITMTTTNGTSTVTRVWQAASGALDLRIYKGATLTLSVDEDHLITNIVFTGKNITNLKVDNVAVDNNSWAGSKQSVTFDVAGTTNIYTIAISVAYTRNVTSGNYGTICLPYGSNNYKGAKFYDIAYMELEDDGTTPKQLWLDEVIGVLKAGKPYIFRASSSKITIAYEGTAVSDPQEGVAGLTGTFNDIASGAELVGNYIIANNKFYLGNQYNSLRANRAYIDYNTIHNNTTPVAEIPGRRRVSMGAASENQATGVDNIVAPEGQAIKVIENGQLIIIRGGEKFNVQGQKL